MDKPSFEESLRALAARRPHGGDHPALAELVAYRAGDLSAEEDDHVQEHLAQCRHCGQLLLDLAEFEQFPPPPDEMAPVDARAEAAWQRLRPELAEGDEEEALPQILELRPRPRLPLWRRPALPWALAAGLALCVVGLLWQAGVQARRIGELDQPQLVRALVTLDSEDDGRRGNAEAVPVHPGEGVAYDLLLSSNPDVPTYPLYRVEVLSAVGEAQPAPASEQPAEDGVLRVVLRSAPDPGDYVFEVFGLGGGEKTLVGRYRFTILPAR